VNAQKQARGSASPFMKTDRYISRHLGPVTIGLGVLVFASTAAIVNFDRAECRAFRMRDPLVASVTTEPTISDKKAVEKGIRAVYEITISRGIFSNSFHIAVTDTTRLDILQRVVAKYGFEMERVNFGKQRHHSIPG
jgi:hypothetical protein